MVKNFTGNIENSVFNITQRMNQILQAKHSILKIILAKMFIPIFHFFLV